MEKGVRWAYALCATCRIEVRYEGDGRRRPVNLGCPRCGGLCPVYCRSRYPLRGMVPTDLASFEKRGKQGEGK